MLGGYHTRHPDVVRFVEPYCQSPDFRIRQEARRFVAKHAEPVAEPPATTSAGPAQIGRWVLDLSSGQHAAVTAAALELAGCTSLPRELAVLLRHAIENAEIEDPWDPRASLMTALARTGEPQGADFLLGWSSRLDLRTHVIDALTILLRRSAPEIAGTSLERIQVLPVEIIDTFEFYDREFGMLEGISAVDTTVVKRLASTELARRTAAAGMEA